MTEKISKVSIKALAAECGVSVATISRVYGSNGKVHSDTRDKVLRKAAELNYMPQQTSTPRSVALIVPRAQTIAAPFVLNMIASLLRGINNAGLSPRFYEPDDVELIEPNLNMAAVLLDWTRNPDDLDLKKYCRKPVIMLNTDNARHFSINTDHAGAVALAVRYLHSHGHRKIGLLVPSIDIWGTRERLRGYREVLQKLNLPFSHSFIARGSRDFAVQPDELSRLLQSGISALVSPHEDWNMQLQYYLRLLNFRVPEDISVITGEIPEMNQWFNPPQTAIRQDFAKIAEAVVEVLQKIKEGWSPEASDSITIAPDLIERASVAHLDV